MPNAFPVFAFRGAELLVTLTDAGARPFKPGPVRPFQDFGESRGMEWPADLPLPVGVEARGLRTLFGLLSPEDFALAGKTFQLLGWVKLHLFCGVCSEANQPHPNELARECKACKNVVYPRLNPAVIVLVTRDNEALLSRSPHFQPGMYSCQAGFVSLGESLEDAVRREVREEIGVELQDVKYFGSQPWPFPNSLMIGFTATWASGEIVCEPAEIEDARWWHKDALPGLPGQLSIARKLIDSWLDSRA